MFERYTEKARRVIFFSRYEASQYGSAYIETEHLLLGLLREDKRIFLCLKFENAEAVRREIDERSLKRPSTPTSIDLPLSDESRRVLAYALEEAERLEHPHIGTEHLLLGLLRENGCYAAEILRNHGVNLKTLREEFGQPPRPVLPPFRALRYHPPPQNTVEIHGAVWDGEYIRDRVKACREYSWHWEKRTYTPCDIAIHRSTGAVSFDTKLSKKKKFFQLVKGGWKKDHCYVCRWELFESKDDLTHGTAYTNGREWLCTECYEKFWGNPNFFASN
jgi:hypothetical protein